MRVLFRLKRLPVLLFFIVFISIQGQTMAERLGYPKNAKLLIIHADDLGLSHSQNMASIDGLQESPVNSASIMVPCPWFPEIAAYAREHTSEDLGLHLTLNSEWKNYKWGPVSSMDLVPSLVNEMGYFYSHVDSLMQHGHAAEVETELRSQIEKAYAAGIDVTHLDTHMGAVVGRPDFLLAYMRLGKEYRLPVLMDKRIYDMDNEAIKKLLDDKTVVLDNIIMAEPSDFTGGMEAYYAKVLEGLNPGLNCLLVHLAYDDEEMKAITVDHPEWGSAWRQADYDFITSQACMSLLQQQGIVLLTWRELRDKIVRAAE
jgi:hypothetical protein